MRLLWIFTSLFLASLPVASFAEKDPLTVGYSDWPGWVAWEVALEKGWFEEAGVDVVFEWFDYAASMEAFSAGSLDAVCMTNGDTLVTGASGRQGQMVLINDFSYGNDMIVGRPGITRIEDLAQRRVGVEVGFVSHLLLLRALESVGLSEDDIELVNVRTNETPMVLASGEVDAIVAWQPNSSQSLEMVPGAQAIYSSRNDPGLIYDVLTVAPESLAERQEDWAKVVGVWYRIVDYLRDPKTLPDGLEIMAGRVGIDAEIYQTFFAGTQFLTREEAAKRFEKSEGLASLWGSSAVADEFNVKYRVYGEPQDVSAYIDDTLYK
jgi:NitT/TauT family transport system substrate-binding protein